jgi:hypothetical protein
VRAYPAVLVLPTFTEHYPETLPVQLPLAKSESWWTGKDSNLRSPQGAADLQSAGFSHSPTRPRKSRHEVRVPLNAVTRAMFGAARAKTQNGLVSKDTSPFMLSCRDSLRLTPLPKPKYGGAGGGN